MRAHPSLVDTMAHSHIASDIPEVPPAEVLAEVDAAWERAARLAADGLRLDVSVGRISGRVRGRLCLEDEVVERLTPSQLLAVACGDPLVRPRGRR
jgi:hypothetical protein